MILPCIRVSKQQHIVACLTEGNDRIRDTAGNNCKLVHNRIQDTVAPFLVTTIGLWIRSQQWYAELGCNQWVVEVSSRRQLVAGVGSTELSKWDVGAVQFRQWDPRSYEC
jgi:hypothetical protein